MEVVQSVFSDHSDIKLDVNNRTVEEMDTYVKISKHNHK